MKIPNLIVPSVEPVDLPPRRVGAEFRKLIEQGAKIVPAGEARHDPAGLVRRYAPKYKLELFDTLFYLTSVRQNPALRFFVAYVVQPIPGTRRLRIHPRIFYKDVSLVWRAASHVVASDDEFWIGKGDVTTRIEDGHEIVASDESTTDLPLEIQSALESLNRLPGFVRTDEAAIFLVLRAAAHARIHPYRDFSDPRKKARAERSNLINRGRSIARFTRRNDPTSLKIVAGFEPDFARGIVDVGELTSAMYGGRLRRFRILSTNRKVQYMFFAGPEHDWIVPPQATTTQLSSFGVRTIDVVADEDLFVPGYEYHYLDDEEDPPVHFSQIPDGFAGKTNHHDDSRADASMWLDRLPIIAEFRKKALGRRSAQRNSLSRP